MKHQRLTIKAVGKSEPFEGNYGPTNRIGILAVEYEGGETWLSTFATDEELPQYTKGAVFMAEIKVKDKNGKTYHNFRPLSWGGEGTSAPAQSTKQEMSYVDGMIEGLSWNVASRLSKDWEECKALQPLVLEEVLGRRKKDNTEGKQPSREEEDVINIDDEVDVGKVPF